MTHCMLGCIADDYTGATDLSSMLARAGLRVIQCFGTPSHMDGWHDFDAVVVALKSRSIPAPAAVQLSLQALQFLQGLGSQRFFFKYCSTFDSTEKGNIGPVADALTTALGVELLLFCPAFPENGRSVYCGYLFVNGVPLHESGMRHHPLNPMTDSNLVRVLQSQSARRVGRLGLADQLPDNSAGYLIVDAIGDEDLRRVAHMAVEHRLLSGGSAIARYWAEALATQSAPAARHSVPEPVDASRSAILAGSCSQATRQQVAQFAERYPVLQLDIAGAVDPSAIAAQALEWCDSQWSGTRGEELSRRTPLLISSASDPVHVAAARDKLGDQAAAQLVESTFAAIASGLRDRHISRLIVAGGETSGAVINALGIQAVRIGREIAPGVPWVRPLGEQPMSLALKSGNFGGPDFFLDAVDDAR